MACKLHHRQAFGPVSAWRVPSLPSVTPASALRRAETAAGSPPLGAARSMAAPSTEVRAVRLLLAGAQRTVRHPLAGGARHRDTPSRRPPKACGEPAEVSTPGAGGQRGGWKAPLHTTCKARRMHQARGAEDLPHFRRIPRSKRASNLRVERPCSPRRTTARRASTAGKVGKPPFTCPEGASAPLVAPSGGYRRCCCCPWSRGGPLFAVLCPSRPPSKGPVTSWQPLRVPTASQALSELMD